MKYNYSISINTERFTIEIDPDEEYGYFERNLDGSNGGLWFDSAYENGIKVDRMLIDYDGWTVLPREVIKALRDNGIMVDIDFE